MLDSIPTSLIAGESVALRLSLAATPASLGWTLRWVIKDGAALVVDCSSTADGDDHLLAVTSEDSAKMPVRELQWQLWGAKASAGISQILGTGRLRVMAGVVGDGRTHEERVLADLEAAQERLAQDDEVEVDIFGRKTVFKDPARLEKLIGIYRAKVRLQRGERVYTLLPVRLR